MSKYVKNHLTLALLIVAVLSLFTTIYFGMKSHKLEAEKLILEKEKAEMSKPIIITAGLRVGGGASSVSFPFYLKNPSNDEYFIDLHEGGCIPLSNLITKSTSKPSESLSEKVEIGDNLTIPQQAPDILYPLPPRQQITLYCHGFDVANPSQDTIVLIRVCIKEKRLTELICENIRITILKR